MINHELGGEFSHWMNYVHTQDSHFRDLAKLIYLVDSVTQAKSGKGGQERPSMDVVPDQAGSVHDWRSNGHEEWFRMSWLHDSNEQPLVGGLHLRYAGRSVNSLAGGNVETIVPF